MNNNGETYIDIYINIYINIDIYINMLRFITFSIFPTEMIINYMFNAPYITFYESP